MADADAAGPHAVVRCEERHLEAIRAIYNHEILHTTALYEYEPRSAETMRAWWAAKQAAGLPVLGIEFQPGVLAGFATWGPFRPFPAYGQTVEHSVYVDVGCRGRGVGRTLLAALVAEARDRGLHTMVGVIDAENVASIALHRRLGFACCGTVREAGHKFGRWLDVEYWQLILPPIPRLAPGSSMGAYKPEA
ncbi:MAG: N-acetyltransferase family protein [Planctomycetia bacterium]